MPSLTDKMKQHRPTIAAAAKRGQGPLWEGPDGRGPNGGVTQGLLAKWLVCKERARILLVEGLKPCERFSKALEYGNMWHLCEEAHAAGQPWEGPLAEHATNLCHSYPLDRAEVEKWWNACRVQFPEYVQFWQAHPDVQARTPLLQEQEFSVPYRLPSGRTVRLRGKWDSVDLIGTGKDAGIFLQENKSKGEVDEGQLKRELGSGFSHQCMFYLVALATERERYLPEDLWMAEDFESEEDANFIGTLRVNPIRGIRYNVIRRPLSGGKGTIVRKEATKGSKCPKCKGDGRVQMLEHCPKCRGVGRVGAKPAETEDAYYTRLAQYIKDEPESYFYRWSVPILPADLERFRRECLDPVLENLCDDWEWWERCREGRHTLWDGEQRRRKFPDHCPRHFRMPFGIRSSLLDGGVTPLDEYLNNGSTAGLERVTVLFPELGGEGGGASS